MRCRSVTWIEMFLILVAVASLMALESTKSSIKSTRFSRTELIYRTYDKENGRVFEMKAIYDQGGRMSEVCIENLCWMVEEIMPVTKKIEDRFLGPIMRFSINRRVGNGRLQLIYGLFVEEEVQKAYAPHVCKNVVVGDHVRFSFSAMISRDGNVKSAVISCDGVIIYQIENV